MNERKDSVIKWNTRLNERKDSATKWNTRLNERKDSATKWNTRLNERKDSATKECLIVLHHTIQTSWLEVADMKHIPAHINSDYSFTTI